jgi:hypothetical protein
MQGFLTVVALIAYEIGALFTFGKLTFFDYYEYNWWNWMIAVPINVLLSQIWPIYWLILRPIHCAANVCY